jgi:hypothetical protein
MVVWVIIGECQACLETLSRNLPETFPTGVLRRGEESSDGKDLRPSMAKPCETRSRDVLE